MIRKRGDFHHVFFVCKKNKKTYLQKDNKSSIQKTKEKQRKKKYEKLWVEII